MIRHGAVAVYDCRHCCSSSVRVRRTVWGKAPYDPAAFDAALHRPGVDTVILVSAESINLIWDPPLDARPFVQDMDARAEFTRLPAIGDAVVYLRQAAPQAVSR